jgi:CRP-like cAMP-binding protein
VHIAGAALRMKAVALRAELRACPSLQPTLLRYAHDVHVQIARGALCHRFHTTPRRLSRWLLDALDRLDCDTLEFTQELLAHVLGVPRTTVSDAAMELQDAGSIWYRHGRIVIKDRQRLKMAACDCYRAKHDVNRARSTGRSRERLAIVR